MSKHFAFDEKLDTRYAEIQKQLLQTGFKKEAVEGAVDAIHVDWAQRAALKSMFSCIRCRLTCQGKVPGCGNPDSPLMIVGEGPGKDELMMRIPFVGAAGTALTIMLEAIGVARHRVYLTNVTHCNIMDENGKLQTPGDEEVLSCMQHLLREIQIVQPKVILGLGNPAMHALTMDFKSKMSAERGHVFDLNPQYGVPAKVLCTWHPSYLIRQKGPDFERVKKEMWQDIWTAIQMTKEAAPSYNFNKKPLFI